MKKETSCINSRAILDYIKEHNNGDCSDLLKDLDPEIDALPDPESFLRDPHNWISCTVISKLYKRAKLILDDESAPYKIGQYAVEKTDLGVWSLILKIFGSHIRVLKNAQRINARWNRNKKAELVELKKSRATLRLHWNPRMDVSKDICLNNQGFYTFIPTTWGADPLILKEKKCYFESYLIDFCNAFFHIFSRRSNFWLLFCFHVLEDWLKINPYLSNVLYTRVF